MGFKEMSVETQYKYKPGKTSGLFAFSRNNDAGEISFNAKNGKDKMSGSMDMTSPWYPKISAKVNSHEARSVAVEIQKDSETLFSGDINLADSGKELFASIHHRNSMYKVELKGNLEGKTKYLEIVTILDGKTKSYKGDLTIEDNHIVAHILSPFEEFQQIGFETLYE